MEISSVVLATGSDFVQVTKCSEINSKLLTGSLHANYSPILNSESTIFFSQNVSCCFIGAANWFFFCKLNSYIGICLYISNRVEKKL